jgi:hypothetical protein
LGFHPQPLPLAGVDHTHPADRIGNHHLVWGENRRPLVGVHCSTCLRFT